MRNKTNRYALLLIIALAAFGLFVVWPDEPDRYFGSAIPLPSGNGLSVGDFNREGMRLGLDLRGGTRTVIQADTTGLTQDEIGNLSDRLDRTVAIIGNRINKFGVSESEVSRQGSNRIVAETPGLTREEARDLIGRTAELKFMQQALDPSTLAPLPDPNDTPRGETCATIAGTLVEPARGSGNDNVEKALTGRFLKPNAFVSTDSAGRPSVVFEFNNEGAKISGQVTGRLQGKPMAIFLDDECVSAPIVQATITDRGTITGVGAEESRRLVAQLNSGALPIPFKIVQQTEVDATLGGDAVKKSVVAGEIAFFVVVVFMVLSYRLMGVLASLALFVYAVTTLMIFKLVPVTLTLSGIAAFVLSLGMAVDANILIFERMKEEIRAGRSLYTAIEHGFDRAWSSIRDSNVSTLITSFILWWFGNQFGAALVKGFALTLGIGVAVSMFSSIFVTRTFLRLLIGTPLARHWELFGVQRPEVRDGVPVRPPPRRLPPLLNLVGNRNFYFLLSFLIMAPGLISLVIPPSLKPGIEFTSGTTATYRFEGNAPSQDELRAAFEGLSEFGVTDARVQKTTEGDFVVRTKELAGVVSTPDVGPAEPSTLDRIADTLGIRFNTKVTVIQSDTVSAIVSEEIVQKAASAVVVATLAILIYIWYAFRGVPKAYRYGISAIVAMFHDVIVVVGLFSIFGKVLDFEINTMFITGLLTVIGFSVHDTIVVFDRIRENLRRGISPRFDVTVNESLLQTLGRSLTTSLTVVFTLVALALLGGSTIRPFVMVLLVGIISGTYSSIAIASQMLVVWENGTLGRPFRGIGRMFGGRGQEPAPGPAGD
ncbi:MAG: protein translocase subunit SecD [Chloroflexi bacterium]|nr:protein translocase subunit SecD [Chloroflexota bacterium]